MSPSSNSESIANIFAQKAKKPSLVWLKILGIVVFVLVLVGGVAAFVGWSMYQQAQVMMVQARELEAVGRDAYAALKNQNLIEVKAKMGEVQSKYTALEQSYAQLKWVNSIPFANAYYQDGQHAFVAGQAGIDAANIAVDSIEPYADVLGFAGQGTFTGGSIENRLKLMLETLSKVTPVMDQLNAKLDVMGKELGQIDEKRYPEKMKDQPVRERIVAVKQVAAGASQALTQARPVFEVLPSVAGADGKRKKYLVLFQNDNELRPTGGFMTAFATLYVQDGVVTPDRSEDIYELDKKFKNKPPIPEILKKYLKTETKWNLRDMNMSPDYKYSMDVFWSYMSKLPGEAKDIDGIIAVDTNVLEKIIAITGPVEVPGYGVFTAEKDKRCDCPQIIYALSEIVDRPTPYLRTNRKGILGPMMRAILSKAYTVPKQQWPQLFGEAWKSIEAKHVQFYFFDPKTQSATEAILAAGRVQPTPEGADYLFIVDTNLGGAKSNLFVQQAVDQEVSAPENGRVKKTVTLTYKNPFAPSNCNLEAGELCLNGKLTDWVRVYLPKDAQIVESLGFDDGSTKTGEEFGHAVFEGVFTLQPLNQAKVKLTYTVPYADPKEYRLYMQKQGGTPEIKHMMRVNGGEQEVMMGKDQLVKIAF